MTQGSGVIKVSTTFLEGRLGLTHKRPSYRPTGTHPSPRSVLVWRSTKRTTLLSSTSRPTLCTHWSPTGNTARPHLVVTRGKRWLVHKPPCSPNVTRKDSMLLVRGMIGPKQESASLEIMKTTATLVTPESDLVLPERSQMTTRVGTREGALHITETDTLRPWVTSWCNDKKITALQSNGLFFSKNVILKTLMKQKYVSILITIVIAHFRLYQIVFSFLNTLLFSCVPWLLEYWNYYNKTERIYPPPPPSNRWTVSLPFQRSLCFLHPKWFSKFVQEPDWAVCFDSGRNTGRKHC